jgi:uncharacterized membrane protein
MNEKIKNELPLIAIVLIPFLYLGYIWSGLPEQIPMHWNASGAIDQYGNKYSALLIPFLLPVLTYGIFLIVPLIDPKKKINGQDLKFRQFKFTITLLMSVLALVILYAINHPDFKINNIAFFLVGFLFIAFGNFFSTIKPNYFIGIRTPWTLQNEQVWKSTHRVASKWWFGGGALLIVLSVTGLMNQNDIIMPIVIGILVIVPLIHSCIKWKELNK